jgi:histidyl-tRNA synthetase
MNQKNKIKEVKNFDFKKLTLDEVDSSGHIAYHYGFTPMSGLKVEKDDEVKLKALKPTITQSKEDLLERISVLRFYEQSGLSKSSNPAMFYFKKSGSSKNNGVCGLEIIGTNKTLAEALIIKTTFAILEEYGHTDLILELNCVGEKESFSKFEKDLNNFIKKNWNYFSKEIKQKIKSNHLSILDFKDKLSDIGSIPTPVSSLSENSRNYFTEVLEFLDSFSIPYYINDSLIPDRSFGSNLVFKVYEVINTKKGEERKLLAFGGRYAYLAKKLGYKKDVAGFNSTIFYNKKTNDKKINVSKISKPKFYIIQIGNHAKLKVLDVIEKLRKEKIPVHHSLMKDKITSQINYAEYLKVSHLLIIGQKEAIEGSVIVRSIELRDQLNIKIDDLPKHLKSISKK